MAAAKKYTPEKVKNILSSFLHVEKNDDVKGDDGNSDGEDQSICKASPGKPRDKKAFYERVQTYTPFTWFAKPDELSPLQCSRYGWENVDTDMLQCTNCRVFLCAKLPQTFVPGYYGECCEKLKHSMRTGHSRFCPWPNNPSPAWFISLPLEDRNVVYRDFLKRLQSLSMILESLPRLQSDALDISADTLGQLMDVAEQQIGQAGRSNRDEFRGEECLSVTMLSLTGWNRDNRSPDQAVLCCKNCQRQIGLWNFLSIRGENSCDQVTADTPLTDHESLVSVDTTMVTLTSIASSCTDQEEVPVAAEDSENSQKVPLDRISDKCLNGKNVKLQQDTENPNVYPPMEEKSVEVIPLEETESSKNGEDTVESEMKNNETLKSQESESFEKPMTEVVESNKEETSHKMSEHGEDKELDCSGNTELEKSSVESQQLQGENRNFENEGLESSLTDKQISNKAASETGDFYDLPTEKQTNVTKDEETSGQNEKTSSVQMIVEEKITVSDTGISQNSVTSLFSFKPPTLTPSKTSLLTHCVFGQAFSNNSQENVQKVKEDSSAASGRGSAANGSSSAEDVKTPVAMESGSDNSQVTRTIELVNDGGISSEKRDTSENTNDPCDENDGQNEIKDAQQPSSSSVKAISQCSSGVDTAVDASESMKRLADEESIAPPAKKMRKNTTFVHHRSVFNPLSEHRSWCPWLSSTSVDGHASPPAPGWKMMIHVLMTYLTAHDQQKTPPHIGLRNIRKILYGWTSVGKSVPPNTR